MNKNFTVLITGRENVGKSSIFNKLINQQKSIVDDFPGVTRDRIFGEAEWMGRHFTVVDTGGILFSGDDLIKKIVIKQVEEIIHDCDLVLMVVDAKEGLLHDDEKIYHFMKRKAKRLVVVVNKVDNEKDASAMYEFHGLGVEKIFPVSAAHSIGLDDVLDYIVEQLPVEEKEKQDSTITKVALIGKENVGKSSLFNALVKEERSIVTDIPGTTRDYVDSLVDLNGRKFVIVDTAGIKKRKSIRQKAEEFSIGRSFSNIKSADIVVHLIDAMQGLNETDKKIIGYAVEHQKGIIIAVNKWDLVEKNKRDSMREEYAEYLRDVLPFVEYVPIVYISAKFSKGLEQLIDIVFYVENQYNFRVKTSILNKVVNDAISHKSPIPKKGEARVYYMTQVAVKPPAFVVFVNKKENISENYIKYLEHKLREFFGFGGVPLKLKLKPKIRD